jgi:hypothetical protein
MRFFLVLVLMLGGCAAVRPLVDPVDAIVAEAVAAARAPAAEQAAMLARAEKAGSAGAADRLRLATLLATLPAPLRDDVRAIKLLEPIADARSPGVGRFAALLATQINERQRIAQELERASRERKRSEEERDKREEALKAQIEALRAIERGILEREEKMRRRER